MKRMRTELERKDKEKKKVTSGSLIVGVVGIRHGKAEEYYS